MTALFQNVGKRAKISYLVVFLLFCLSFSSLMAQEYAFIYIQGGTGTNTVGTSWTNVGAGLAADFAEANSSSNWSLASNVLTAASNAAVEGEYCIKYSLSFKAAVSDWYVGISIDGAAPQEPVFGRSIGNSRKDAGNISGIMMVSITQGQTIQLVVRSSSTTPIDFTPGYAQLVICPAAQNIENYYGGMYIDGSVPLNGLTTTFAKVVGFSAADELNGWTFASNGLTAGAGTGGLYYMSFSASYSGDGNESSPVEYSFEIARNDSNNITRIMTNRSASSLDVGNVSGGGLVLISPGDIISMEVMANLNNNDITINKSSLSLFKLGDTSPNSRGGMIISSDQSVTINAQDEWTTVGNYSLAGANNWGLSSNVFTLNSTDAYGYYFLEFTTSLMTANATGDDLEMGVFIGTSLNPNLSIYRSLSSNTDVGAVCGVGLFQADGPDSTITLKVRNTTSSSNFTIKKSMVGFSQIRYVASDTPLPITLNNFTAEQDKNVVQLNWQTVSETDNAQFLIYRDDEVIASLPGAGTTSEPHYYHYTDNYAIPGKTYTYTLADVSYSNVEVKHDDYAVRLVMSEGNIAKDYSIGKAYPNPFNPLTIIPVNLAREAQVNAKMYDLAGHEIMNIFDGSMNAGSHELRVESDNLSAGVYLIHINVEGISTIQKISLMK